MEFRQLGAYVKVYELRSFSRTAQEMFVSQPSISAYINSLEKELQTQLICRSTKEILPTKSGILFYEYAKEMLSLHDKAIASMKSLSDCAVGSIDILASTVPAQYILPEILGAFHKLYPNIIFNVTQTNSTDVVSGIVAHKCEIGFVGTQIDNSKCIYEHFMSEKLLLIVPCEPHFQDTMTANVAQLLRSEHFVARKLGSGTRLEYEEFMKKIGVNPRELKVSAYMNDTQSIIQAVANGLGLSFVSELAARNFIRQKLIISADIDELPERKFYIVLKKGCPVVPAVDTFIKFIRTYFQSQE